MILVNVWAFGRLPPIERTNKTAAWYFLVIILLGRPDKDMCGCCRRRPYETKVAPGQTFVLAAPATRHLSEQLWYSHSAPLFPQLLQVRSLGIYGGLTSKEVRRPVWLCTRSRDVLLRVVFFSLIFLEFLGRDLLYLAQLASIHSKISYNFEALRW